MPSLVHLDQTGFIKGRCITENFIYTAELVQCCHRRKTPAIILKVDFRKAFDSINWAALDGSCKLKVSQANGDDGYKNSTSPACLQCSSVVIRVIGSNVAKDCIKGTRSHPNSLFW